MSYIRIIPSILISDGKCIKGKRFENHINVGNPVTTAISFDSQKADEIFLIDINAYRKKITPDYKTLSLISENISTPLTFGGNICSIEDIKNSFKFGADKIYLNSYLYKDCNLINEAIRIYGSQSIVGGINLTKKNNDYGVFGENNDLDPIKHLNKLVKAGVGELKITFVDHEGMRSGLDNDYCKYINENINVPCIFEGGIGNLEDIKSSIMFGTDSIALGSLLYFSDYNVVKIKKYLINEKLPVSLDY